MTKRTGRAAWAAATAARALGWVLFDHDCGADSDMALCDCGEPMFRPTLSVRRITEPNRDPTSSVENVAERILRDYVGQATRCYRYSRLTDPAFGGSVSPYLSGIAWTVSSCLSGIACTVSPCLSGIAWTSGTTNQNNEVDVVRSRIENPFNPRPSSTRIASSRCANFLRYRSFSALNQNRSS
jgi:hypothetical protein